MQSLALTILRTTLALAFCVNAGAANLTKVEYKTCVEKCNAFADAAQTKCVSEAKTKFGQN